MDGIWMLYITLGGVILFVGGIMLADYLYRRKHSH